MSTSYRLLVLFFMLFSSSVQAFDVFFDPLYWRATETAEWVYSNDRNVLNQNISYKTINFDYTPGFRVGAGFKEACIDAWDLKIFYTNYYTKAKKSAKGNLVSTFLGGKLVQGNNFYFRSGQVNFTINLNMLDLDLSKNWYETDTFMLKPVIGLRGGKINQTIITRFQGPLSIVENVKNNFKGLGPKAGLEGKWTFCQINDYQWGIVSDFTTSYLAGRWRFRDVTHISNFTTLHINNGKRSFGSLTLQGLLGIKLDYNCFSAKLGYEISDWFNQYQVLDDGTGAHNNDLILQGITLRLSYTF